MSGRDEEQLVAPAVARAEVATEAWRDAARMQLRAEPNHSDLYALAAEIVASLSAVQDLTSVLRDQVTGYGQGRAVYDDTRTVDPQARLAEAGVQLAQLHAALTTGLRGANGFWSAIGHIGVEVPS
jgi:hypothetical protein